MEIIGYKAFYPGLITKFNDQMEVGKKYHIEGQIKYGWNGNGYHFCKRLEDTLRYLEAWKYDIEICLVKGSGHIIEGEDNYYGYYDLYACSDLEILKKLTKEEIFNYGYNLKGNRLERFLTCYRLNKNELQLIKNKLSNEHTDYETKILIKEYLKKISK